MKINKVLNTSFNEVWRPIFNNSDYYEVSNLGNIRSVFRVIKKADGFFQKTKGKILKANPSGNEYLRVSLNLNGIQKYYPVHRIVALTFIPNPENKCCTNHKNGIKTDNRVENLEWVTKSENAIHSFRVLKNKAHFTPRHLNKRNRPVSQHDKITGKLIKKFINAMEAQEQTGIWNTDIGAAAKGIKLKSAGGFKWKYL